MRELARATDNFSQFMRCADGVSGYLRRRVRNPEVAAELFQEVSIVVLRHPGAPAEGQSFCAWFRGIARNAVAHHFRHQRRQASLLSRAEPEAHSLLAQAPHDPERSFEVRELLDHILTGVDERSRKLMVERYLLGRSTKEIAHGAAQSPTAIRMKLMRARDALQKQLEPHLSINPQASDQRPLLDSVHDG